MSEAPQPKPFQQSGPFSERSGTRFSLNSSRESDNLMSGRGVEEFFSSLAGDLAGSQSEVVPLQMRNGQNDNIFNMHRLGVSRGSIAFLLLQSLAQQMTAAIREEPRSRGIGKSCGTF